MPIVVYEMHVYSLDESGTPDKVVEVVKMPCFDQTSAARTARKLALKAQAPVDVARQGHTPWNDRYVGTAMPKYPENPKCRMTVWERID